MAMGVLGSLKRRLPIFSFMTSMVNTSSRASLFIFFSMAGFIVLAGTGHAFHEGGAGACEGCHSMHNSLDGRAAARALPQYQAGAYLLKASDQSSVCLNCHQHAGDTAPSGFHISTSESDMPTGSPPIQLSPGGDFGWLKKTYSWTDANGALQTSPGYTHGHNITAYDYGYAADGRLTTAPGGGSFQYPSNQLSCISCHDPHGRYRRSGTGTISTTGGPIIGSGSYNTSMEPFGTISAGTYRLLGGAGYQPKSLAGSYAFLYNPFFAAAPEDYNRSENTTDVRVAYGQNVSQWCANCHAMMHSSVGTLIHPADQAMSSLIISNYNSYVKTGDLTGTQATSYLSLVPFQMGDTTDMTTLKGAVGSAAGPVSGDRVMCLSCHRAHASGWESMMRFPLDTTFTTVADSSGYPVYPDPGTNPTQAMGRTTQEFQKALYDRPPTKFAAFQRTLCNKCHVQDGSGP
ncbi:Putative cytochrome c (omcT) [Candidatus Sulfobium mesophilum]|uniref:Cytochrome c (OmcT) n=1 Tax=Candidatus Sulfobium mesophilum TaxID=2016548 RepID=A0A2U3QGJ1_9BACT|nr:Putative cytochrome c (omcT) [Candidatus Sulfobium mesophilum]